MKRIILITVLIAGLTASYGFAAMGGRMGSDQGHMGSDPGHMEGMLQGHEVRGSMMHNMGQMSRLMQQMRDMMANKPNAESMSQMSGLMQDISEHILEMSRIMKRGTVTQKEMQMLDQHNSKMQGSYDMMRW